LISLQIKNLDTRSSVKTNVKLKPYAVQFGRAKKPTHYIIWYESNLI